MVVAVAHPDDEVLGCGALLARLRDVKVIHVTDGAPKRGTDAARQGFSSPAAYAAARRKEAEAALAVAGVEASRLVGLGCGDQEVSANLVSTARELARLFAEADVVLTHAFEGGHSDHDAVAFAARAAFQLMETRPAELIEMPFYYGDEAGWVRQQFLPNPNAGEAWVNELDAGERNLKTRMIAAHRTQHDTLSPFDLAAEKFRRAPAYDFEQRPHSGPLLYERHGWNLTWDGWVAQVADAISQLKLDPCR